MVEEQKMETVEEVIVEEIKKKIEAEEAKSGEVKMEEDPPAIKVEIEEKENVKRLVLKAEPECEDLVKLVIEGIETGDDENEEFVIMSPEEIRIFLEQKISEHVRDPKVNPLLALQKRSEEILEEIKDRAEEITKLGKALDIMYRNQERFLRHVDIFPKVPTNSVSVSVDLPLLLDSVPLMSPTKAPDEDAVIRKDLSDARVMIPTVAKNKAAAALQPTSSPLPTVPSAITITPALPNTASSTAPGVSKVNSTPSTSTAPAAPKASPSVPVSNLSTTMKSLPKLAPKAAGGDIECIDLTDDTPAPPPVAVSKPVVMNSTPMAAISLVKHPAPLPPKPFSTPNPSLPNVPPKPRLKISSEERGIVLQWDMPPIYSNVVNYADLKSFDIFGYQEQRNVVINTLLWKKIGNVNAMTLPMACTLTQFLEGQKYHFAIRAVDVYDRSGSYSDPISIVYKPLKKA